MKDEVAIGVDLVAVDVCDVFPLPMGMMIMNSELWASQILAYEWPSALAFYVSSR